MGLEVKQAVMGSSFWTLMTLTRGLFFFSDGDYGSFGFKMNHTDLGGDVSSTVTGVSVVLVQSSGSWQFNYTHLLILSYGAIFATGLVGNSLVILTLTRNQRGKVSFESTSSEQKRNEKNLVLFIRDKNRWRNEISYTGLISDIRKHFFWRLTKG